MESVRIDRWLCAARVYASRSLAGDACSAGRVRVNGAPVRASRLVRVGDEVRAVAPRGPIVFEITALADKRLAAPKARELYNDHSPPPPPRDERLAVRTRGAGRPTKADRRALEKLRDE